MRGKRLQLTEGLKNSESRLGHRRTRHQPRPHPSGLHCWRPEDPESKGSAGHESQVLVGKDFELPSQETL